MKKIIIVIFVLVALILLGFYFFQDKTPVETIEIQQSKVIVPTFSTTTEVLDEQKYEDISSETFNSYIPLNSDETLINSYAVTISPNDTGDVIDDQVSIIRKVGQEGLFLLIGLYKPETSSYVRSAELSLPISQINTFSLSCLDVIGNHQNALIVSGVDKQNATVFQVFLPTFRNGVMTLEKIADFTTNGTIYVQELSRKESYSLGQSSGESFSIIENCPDPAAESNSLDQLQITYSWNPLKRIYEIYDTKKVPGRTINANELDRILDGTVETFSSFLNGLWYKTSSSELRQIFFDTTNKEIICLANNTQEVYDINTSWMRKSGISMTTENKSMSTITRSFVITLLATDEIKIKATDDLRMIIGEDSLWDGTYKKQTTAMTQEIETEKKAKYSDILQTSFNKWTLGENEFVSFVGTEWTYENEDTTQKGVFVEVNLLGKTFIEFRGNGAKSLFSGYYDVLYQQDEDTEKTETLVLQPISISTNLVTSVGDLIRLTRTTEE